MRRALVLLVGVLIAVLVACNAISGLDGDFVLVPFDGGPSDGTDATTTTDGATDDGRRRKGRCGAERCVLL